MSHRMIFFDAFETDAAINEAINDKENFLFQLAAQQRYSDYQRTVWDQMRQIDKNRIYDQQLYRQVNFMSNIGPSALPPDQLDRVITV